ncbi:VWA domain-containing protein [Candidatus Woesearchaeota archaeon]|nr:VWA domain-containing protein [Candidatus Woesearchaeota archaeon]
MFVYPIYLWMIIPLFFVLSFLLMRDFIRIDHDLKENKSFMRRRKTLKTFMFISRFVIFSLVLVLFAKPFIELQTTESGSPKVTILVDNSSSMDVYDMSFVDGLVEDIKKEIPVKVRMLTSDPSRSNLGDDIISYLEQDTNILVISDLQVTDGITLDDALLHSSFLNATISGINLESNKKDVSVWIEADDKATRDQEMVFTVHINKLNIAEYNLVVNIDGNPVFNARDTRSIIQFTHTFNVGDHIIEAKLIGEDDVSENNVFYKTVTVVPQPKVLYVTRTNSRLPDVLSQYYDITRMSSIPGSLEPYYAIVIEDMSASQITRIDDLSDYVSEGNGLFVIGGMNSYDRGGYKRSGIETILPVAVGKGDKKQGDSNIVLLIDMSGSTQSYWKKNDDGELVEVVNNQPLDVIKALAVDVIETLNRGNRVGVVAFAIPDPNDRLQGTFKAVKISDIDILGNIKQDAIDKISRIDAKGQSLFDVGFAGAYSLIRHESGARNVIIITDGGKNVYSDVKEGGLRTVQLMAQEGIKTYTVGVGRNPDSVDEDYLKTLALAGGGLYFPAGQENKLKILFGTPEEKEQGDEMDLFILNPVHFITKDLDLDAKVYGFNQVVPKSLSRTIITTDSGEPALVEWRYGIGKVLSLTVFSGNAGLGQLLNGENSRLLTRSINYLIGDPERKLAYSINIPDTYINDIVDVEVISQDYPIADIELVKIRDNQYVGKTKPGELGINTLLDKPYAVNYEKEYQKIGMNPEAGKVVEVTGGKMFNQEDIDQLIEHIKSVSKRTRITKTYITWPLLILILIIYIFEIAVRKIVENRRKV